jgi:thiol-disulfide isomerase/thioredoxin
LAPLSLFSQEIKISLKNLSNEEAYLYKLEGENKILIDTVYSENSMFSLNPEIYRMNISFYRLEFNKNIWLNFLYDGQEIEITSDYNSIIDSLNIIKSKSNKLFYDFLKINKEYKTKTELLNFILVRFPQDDEYYETTQDRLKELQIGYSDFVQNLSQTNANSLIARYIRTAQLPVIPDSIPIGNHLNYLKSHALDHVDFNDTELIYSDAFTNKTIEYLTYYRNPQLPKELLEKEFIKAADRLLNKAKINQLVYQQITDYLIDGFKQYGFDKIIDYIIEHYVIADDLCLDEETENSIQKRIDQSKILSIGAKVPNIIMPDINGEVVDLSIIEYEKTLLVFYSIECPHCKILLPRLSKIQENKHYMKIIAISLDQNNEDWIKFVEDNKLELIHISDPNGWGGQIASDYYIYATPTMFLLDNQQEIIGKPTTFEDLSALL